MRRAVARLMLVLAAFCLAGSLSLFAPLSALATEDENPPPPKTWSEIKGLYK